MENCDYDAEAGDAVVEVKDLYRYGIPPRFDKDPEFDGKDKYLLMKIRNLAWRFGYCYAKNKDLAFWCGITVYELRKRLKFLEEKKAIRIVPRPGQSSLLYPID